MDKFNVSIRVLYTMDNSRIEYCVSEEQEGSLKEVLDVVDMKIKDRLWEETCIYNPSKGSLKTVMYINEESHSTEWHPYSNHEFFITYLWEIRELKTRVLKENKKHYWYVNSCLDVAISPDIGVSTDKERYNAGNYKETYEEAVKLRDMLREHAQAPETGYVDGYHVKEYTEELGFSIKYMEGSNIEAREQITHKLGFGGGSTEFLMAQLRLEQAYRKNMWYTGFIESVIWVTGAFGTVRKYNVDPENFSKELGGLGFEYFKLIKGRAPEGYGYFYLDSGFDICTKTDDRTAEDYIRFEAGNYRRNRRDIVILQAKFMETSRKVKEGDVSRTTWTGCGGIPDTPWTYLSWTTSFREACAGGRQSDLSYPAEQEKQRSLIRWQWRKLW